MGKVKLTCLGTGDGHPSGERSHSAFLYEFDGATVLLDCGEPVTKSLMQHRVPADAIDRVFLSHLHSDHLGGFFMLIQSFWLRQRKKPLTVHLPEEGLEPVQQLLRSAYLFDELMPFDMKFETWQGGNAIEFNDLTTTPFNTTHLERLREHFQPKHPEQSFEAFSFTMETSDMRVGHSADIGHLNDLDPLVTQPLDLLLCELAHVEPLDLFEYLAGRSIGQVVFTHVSQGHWNNESAFRQLAAEKLGKLPHIFATDGGEIIL